MKHLYQVQETITRYSKKLDSEDLKIFTCREKHQPRLLVISVDVAMGKAITFDSFHEEAKDPNNPLYYDDGITMDHVMASGTIPEKEQTLLQKASGI